jgi:hypothetical protein
MTHIRVSSSVIESVAHDPQTEKMEVKFHTGALYRYHSVPEEDHAEFVNAKSVGVHFNNFVRGEYGEERIQ